ncbi:hypothetical protein OG21DRAFT_1460685 [Imleria badia]|nr:hypothetical protein OG21DRAFT_1460685 [Imleria badia]
MRSEVDRWAELRRRYWIPNDAKADPTHESRNSLLMCSNHHKSFDAYVFFIRFFPDFQKYVFINYSDNPDDRQYHGKAIALQPSHRYAPLPSLFIIHEMRVRGFNPFQPIDPSLPHDLVWQDWILSDGEFGNTDTVSSDRSPSGNQSAQPLQQVQLMPTVSGHTGGRRLALNAGIISEILAATRAVPSWKACQVEGTSWTGTAEENIQKYISDIGVQDSEV